MLTDEDVTIIRLIDKRLTLREIAAAFDTSAENVRLIQSHQTHTGDDVPVRPARVAELLTRLRDEMHLSDREIARQLGTDNKTVAQWRTGTRIPRHPDRLAVACIRVLTHWREQDLVSVSVHLPRAMVAEARRLGDGNVSAGLRRMLGESSAPSDRRSTGEPRGTDVGLRVRRLRQHLRWSQTQLADVLGVKQSTVSAWEQGERRLRYTATLARIAALEARVAIPPDSTVPDRINLSQKLSEEDKRAIHERKGKSDARDLAAHYHVGIMTIYRIWNIEE